ncbi:unnamed protein product [Notodromas monacha]|uniref:RING-type E3 ubiquitin transferase n=1 Tax=Notodromas monacha TaxID=399045 RepID=A0A7R9BUS8_9CRUS|nr:unnamed protein product [Notodromas monacha]CAG0922135.1 unnamed protein product [Notodromas monacha]
MDTRNNPKMDQSRALLLGSMILTTCVRPQKVCSFLNFSHPFSYFLSLPNFFLCLLSHPTSEFFFFLLFLCILVMMEKQWRMSGGSSRCKPSVPTVDSQSILDHFKCSSCKLIMLPPLPQCKRGHLVCLDCRHKSGACPACQGPLSGERNMAMELVAESVAFPCKYPGCGEFVQLGCKKKHEDGCSFQPLVCPVCCVGVTGLSHGLFEHMDECHPKRLRMKNPFRICLQMQTLRELTRKNRDFRDSIALQVDLKAFIFTSHYLRKGRLVAASLASRRGLFPGELVQCSALGRATEPRCLCDECWGGGERRRTRPEGLCDRVGRRRPQEHQFACATRRRRSLASYVHVIDSDMFRFVDLYYLRRGFHHPVGNDEDGF